MHCALLWPHRWCHGRLEEGQDTTHLHHVRQELRADRSGTEDISNHHEMQAGPLRLITMQPGLVDTRAPLLPTAADGHRGVRCLPQGRLLTGRPVGGTVYSCGDRVDQLLEGFPWGKRGDLFRRNRDRGARARVAS